MNKDKNICFIVPVHPPHFEYLNGIIASHKNLRLDKQSDVWVIFTDETEAEKYSIINIKKLALPDFVWVTAKAS